MALDKQFERELWFKLTRACAVLLLPGAERRTEEWDHKMFGAEADNTSKLTEWNRLRELSELDKNDRIADPEAKVAQPAPFNGNLFTREVHRRDMTWYAR
jgi:hypothetical protein